MAEPETPDQLVMTRIGGGRSALAAGAAFAIVLAGGWLLLALGGGSERPAASPPTSAAAVADGPVQAAPTPTTAPSGSPTLPPEHVTAPVGEQLMVGFVTGERRYEIPLRMGEPGTFTGGTSLTYPLGLGATVELVHVVAGAGAARETSAGSWQAVFYSAGGPDRDVSILEYAAPARPALRHLPGILRHGYRLVVTADGGHYPQLSVRLTSPYGLRLSRPGACEGGWRWMMPEDHC